MPDVAATFHPRLSSSGPLIPDYSVVVPMSSALFVDPDTAVSIGEQNGTPGAPYATVQQAVDALSGRGQGTVLLAPGLYPAEVVNVAFTQLTLMGIGSTVGGADLGSVIVNSNSNVSLVGVANLGALVTTGAVRMVDSFTNNTIECGTLTLYGSTVGTIDVVNQCDAWSSTFLDGGSASRITAHASRFETLGTSYLFTSGGGELFDCDFFADLLADSPTFRGCTLAGAFTGSNFTAYSTRLAGGSVNVTVTIALDQFTYQSAPDSSWVATNGLSIVDAPWTPEFFQIGWNALVPSTTFAVLQANQHRAGLYLIYAPFVIRDPASAGTVTRTITWSTPTLGAQSKVDAAIPISIGTGTRLQDVVAIVSDGTADVTVAYTSAAVTGTVEIDIYTAALQGGLRLL